MKNKYQALKIGILCITGVFIGTSLYRIFDYHAHPLIYDMYSAPWYTSIAVGGIFTAIADAILLLWMFVLKRKTKANKSE